MPARKHVLVTFGGTFGTGTDQEIWQCGVKMGPSMAAGGTGGGNLNDLTGYVGSIQAGLSSWFAGVAFRNDFKLTFVKAANITDGDATHPYGKYNGSSDFAGGPNPAVYTYGTPVPGGSAVTGAVPQILTLAVTFRNAAAPKGPRHSASHGRIYPPFAVGSNGQDRISGVSSFVSAGTALLTALAKPSNDWGTGGVVATRPMLIGVDGTVRPVDQVAVGDVLDTVRNRKSKLRETYSTVAWS